jgi:hypothetical protein
MSSITLVSVSSMTLLHGIMKITTLSSFSREFLAIIKSISMDLLMSTIPRSNTDFLNYGYLTFPMSPRLNQSTHHTEIAVYSVTTSTVTRFMLDIWSTLVSLFLPSTDTMYIFPNLAQSSRSLQSQS